MATTDRLNVAITADASQFNKQIKSIQGQLDKTAKSVNDSVALAQQQTEAALFATTDRANKAGRIISSEAQRTAASISKTAKSLEGDLNKTTNDIAGNTVVDFKTAETRAEPIKKAYSTAFIAIRKEALRASKVVKDSLGVISEQEFSLRNVASLRNELIDIFRSVDPLEELWSNADNQLGFNSLKDTRELMARYLEGFEDLLGPTNEVLDNVFAETDEYFKAIMKYQDDMSEGNWNKVVAATNKVRMALSQLKEEAKQAAVEIGRIHMDPDAAATANNATKQIKGISKAVGETAGKTDQWSRAGTKLTGKISLAMILVRIIFKLIQEIINALKQCTDVLQDFDPKFAKDWEKFIGTVKQLKAELSAAFAPILQSVVPILTEIINKVREFIQELGKGLAILSGSDSWIKAKDQVDEYGKSVKAAKRELLGFDQVNKLNANAETKYESEDLINDNQINLFKEAFEGLKKILQPILNIMTSSIADSVELLKEIGPLLQPLFDLVSAVLEPIGTIFSKALKAVTKLVSPIVSKLVPAITNILSIVTEIVDIILTALDLDEIFVLLEDIGEWLGDIIGMVWEIIEPILNVFKPLLRTIAEIIGFIVGSIARFVGDFQVVFKVAKLIADVCGAILKTVFAIFELDWKSIPEIWQEFGAKAKKIFSDIGDWWNRVVSKFSNGISKAWNSVVNTLIHTINTLTNAINRSVLAVLNAISEKFGWGWHLEIPPIPTKLAKGGVITSPTNAILGEYAGANTNPEIAAPRSMIAEIVNEGSESTNNILIQLGRQIITAIDNKDLEVTIGDDVIASSAARGNRAFYNRTGKELIGV